MENARGGIVPASAAGKPAAKKPFKISPRERRATDKQEPRFHRKQGRVSTFGLIEEQGKRMPTTEGTKPAGKSGRRKGKGEPRKKAVAQESLPESPVAAQLQSPDQEARQQPQPGHAVAKVDQQPAIEEPVVAIVATPEPQPAVALASAEPPPAEPKPAEPVSAESRTAMPPPAAPASPELTPVSLQTIANAYRDYTRKSIEEFGSFVEQLSGVRTLDKAMTVQSEFVKRAYETSVAESQKICELHNKLAKQTLQPFQGLMGKMPETRRKP
jgi:phasin family protein